MQELNDLYHIPLLCRQPLATGVLQLHHVGKGAADLRELQQMEASAVLLRYLADALQDAWILQLHLAVAAGQQAGLVRGGVTEPIPPPAIPTQANH